jgi:hypothetical protein
MHVIIDRWPIDHAEICRFFRAILQLLQDQAIPAEKVIGMPDI